MRKCLVALALFAVATTAFAGDGTIRKAANPVAGSYIVVLNEGAARPADAPVFDGPSVAAVADDMGLVYGGRPEFVYDHALQGFSIKTTAPRAAMLARDWRVAYVEEDGVVSIDTTQTNATWGIDRIDQRSRPLSGTYTYFNTGAGVKAYIIDTGIRRTHTQFGGRAIFGFDAVTSGGTANDCHGHGTHVAGTVGGSIHGVAKGVTLVAVRVLNCSGSGTTSGVVAGINFVTSNHLSGQPAVANMSLGGGVSSSIDSAVQNSINDGVSYAIAAGNNNGNACNTSPARVAAAMTIGSTTSTDARSSFSNFGSCVDWFAPGSSITSAWNTSDTATRTISGTSMATPHTAGVAALYLQSNPGASPATVRTALFNLTTKGIVTGSNSTNNHLLFTNF
jgi:subtilisin family serine protease